MFEKSNLIDLLKRKRKESKKYSVRRKKKYWLTILNLFFSLSLIFFLLRLSTGKYIRLFSFLLNMLSEETVCIRFVKVSIY
jgi:hypothetical protein